MMLNQKVWSLFALAACGLLIGTANATEPAASARSYQLDKSDTVYALSVRARHLEEVKRGHDHVVLIDTSASQKGDHRTQAFGVLHSLLKALPETDRVSVVAVDLEATPITTGMVAPNDQTITSVMRTLNQRIPLGATNMQLALAHAMKQLNGKGTGSILYIGDGMSTANLIGSDELKGLVNSLRSRQIPVHSYAVGPRTDIQLLGTLGQMTGGRVLIDRMKENSATAAGDLLAVALNAPIFFPAKTDFKPTFKAVMPDLALPIRTDRDTVYLAKGKVAGDIKISLHNDHQKLEWTIANKSVQTGNTFLSLAWNRAEQSHGLNVPYAGKQFLNDAQNEFDGKIARALEVGRVQVGMGNTKQAETIGLDILKVDPHNVQAKALVDASTKRKQMLVALADDDESLLDKASKETGKNLLDGETKRRKVITQMMTVQVKEVIKSARRISSTEPDAALDELKQAKEAVVAATDMEVEARQQLLKRIEAVRQDVSSRKEVNEQLMIRYQERLAQQQAQRALLDRMRLEEEKLQQLIERVRSLMVEGVHGKDDAFEEAESVAESAIDINPTLGVSTVAFFNAEAAGQLRLAMRMRALRADRFLETLRQVELSHVPFPDEPPVRWPPAEVWKALTERRRKWASVSLESHSKAEERITKALGELTEVEFIDTPLSDAMEYLADYHGITILIDDAALTEEGTDSSEVINKVLSGIKLRSALKLILEPLNLTYVIKNEVMMITSETKAGEEMSTRVYPVGDLVIPISTPLAGGLGQGLGGVGGFQGQGGLGGGGQFGQGGVGFGGNQGGGGLGGGGGGFFMVPPQAMQPQKAKMNANQNPPKNVKKKPVLDPDVQNILNNILGEETSQISPVEPVYFAQIGPAVEKPFRLDNSTIRDLKKKQ